MEEQGKGKSRFRVKALIRAGLEWGQDRAEDRAGVTVGWAKAGYCRARLNAKGMLRAGPGQR